MTKEAITSEMRKELRKPFPAEAYSKHPTKTFLTTLKAMYITERLNDVFGIGRWSINVEIIERTDDYVLVQGEFICLDHEVLVPKQFGGHKTTGKNTEIADGYKSALTDCQSKIASYFEVGIDMFKGKIKVGGSTYTKPAPKKTYITQVKTPPPKPKPKKTTPKALKKMEGKNMTPEYLNVITAITDGKLKSITDVEKYYILDEELKKELVVLIANHNK